LSSHLPKNQEHPPWPRLFESRENLWKKFQMVCSAISDPTEDRTLIEPILNDLPDISDEIRSNLRSPLPVGQRRRQLAIKYSLSKYSGLGGKGRDGIVVLIGLIICHVRMHSGDQLDEYDEARNNVKNRSTPEMRDKFRKDAHLKSRKAFKKAHRYLLFAAHARLGYSRISAPVIDIFLPLLIDLGRNKAGQSTVSKEMMLATLRDSFRQYRTIDPNLMERATVYLEHLSSNAGLSIGPALNRYARIEWPWPKRPQSVRRV